MEGPALTIVAAGGTIGAGGPSMIDVVGDEAEPGRPRLDLVAGDKKLGKGTDLMDHERPRLAGHNSAALGWHQRQS